MAEVIKSILWGAVWLNAALTGFNTGQGVQAALASRNPSQEIHKTVVQEEKPLILTRMPSENPTNKPLKLNLESTESPIPPMLPTTHYDISQRGLDLIKKYEGFAPKAYKCPADVLTIGYGTTSGVKPGDTITKEQAESRLREDVNRFEYNIDKSVKIPLTQKEFDSLTSFTYNVGPTAFRNSTLLRKLNSKDRIGASNEFKRWNKANGKVLNGLTRRRSEEEKLFRGK